MSGTPVVSVIIISYNTCETTLRCLRELYAAMACPAEVIVVDNASTDPSVAQIVAAFPAVKLIRNDRNAGFGSANNQGMRCASGRYFLLLNSDAFVLPGAVEALVDFLEEHPEAAMAGPRLLNADGSLQRSCFHFPTPTQAWIDNLWLTHFFPNHPAMGGFGRWDHDRERYVDFVSGACMLVRRTAYEAAGGFDEAFFMYAEETDWQRRMHTRGWLVGFTPKARVVHLGGGSGQAASIRRRMFESLDHYQYKHHGFAGLLSVRLAMVVGNAVRAAVWSALLMVPGRRKRAASKLKLALWLLLRQSTHWHGVTAR